MVKPLVIGFTGIGPMLGFASFNYSKSVASGFTLHKTRCVSLCGLAIHIFGHKLSFILYLPLDGNGTHLFYCAKKL